MKQLSTKQWVGVGVALSVAFLFLAFSGFFYGMIGDGNETFLSENKINKTNQMDNNETEKVLDLKVVDTKIGNGVEAKSGSLVTVHYVGTLKNGKKFDSSIDRGEPFQFVLGVGQVIRGWDVGVNGMKVGGKRNLVIPSSMAYGENEIAGVIPSGSDLIFDVELLKVEN